MAITDQADTAETTTVNQTPCNPVAGTCTPDNCVNLNNPVEQAKCELC